MATTDDFRRLALSLPEVSESDHFDAPSFRVKTKLFAVLRASDRVTLKLEPEDQDNLVQVHPGVVEPVSGAGARIASAARAGWTFVRLDACDEALLASLLRLAWSGVAPKRLLDPR